MASVTSITRVALVALSVLVSGTAAAADPPVRAELNKLEAIDNACRAYLVLENTSEIGFESLKLDLVMFDLDGIIAERLAVDAAPLPVGKTSLKVFDIVDLPCPQIGRMLLNDVVACSDANGPRSDCVALLSTHTRGSVAFIK